MPQNAPLELKLKAHSRLARMNPSQKRAALKKADRQLAKRWTPAAAAMKDAGVDLVYAKMI